jgi:hypothetical protein
MSGSVAIPEDILLWPDDFWFFRNELCKEFMREDNYRVVHASTQATTLRFTA